MKLSTNQKLRAISFGEIFTSRTLYGVIIVFAVAAVGAFILVGSDIYTIFSFAGDIK